MNEYNPALNIQQQQFYVGKGQNVGIYKRGSNSSSAPFTVDNVCSCGAIEKLEKVMRVNQCWKKDYTELLQENNLYKAKLKMSEDRLKIVEEENQKMQQRLRQLEEKSSLQTPPLTPPITPSQTPNKMFHYSIDDVEALKQQLIIYKEDYEHEKKDHGDLKDLHSQMKLELEKCKEIIEKLKKKNDTIKENYRRVSSDKEHIISQLRQITTSTTSSPPYLLTRSNFPLVQLDSELAYPGSGNQNYVHNSGGKVSPLHFYGGVVERDGGHTH